MRLAAHVCAATTHCCDKVRETFPTVPGGGRTPEKPSQPSPEEGARRDELALRRQWHLGSSRDRGGRRQCHVGIAAGAASGMSGSRRRQCHVGIAAGAASVMSGSRRAPPVACRDRCGRSQWHVGIGPSDSVRQPDALPNQAHPQPHVLAHQASALFFQVPRHLLSRRWIEQGAIDGHGTSSSSRHDLKPEGALKCLSLEA
jgi:hypothetical protein